MIKKNSSKPVRVAPPILEDQQHSTITIREWLKKEETISDLLFSRNKEEEINVSHKSIKNCTFQYQIFSECQFNSSQLTDIRF